MGEHLRSRQPVPPRHVPILGRCLARAARWLAAFAIKTRKTAPTLVQNVTAERL
ncbi:hypothetical protein VHA_000902 [Grimontia hollisae CIP 101886]|uniref:Uncharacterized protein n=1 Tax=Grimontia hollisae CIP 101886 TaxID=675812 RepID=D0I585_GRIHO|nr:hypothetical protein VHA_000902 [Grimontia hollisae CIP 101886]